MEKNHAHLPQLRILHRQRLLLIHRHQEYTQTVRRWLQTLGFPKSDKQTPHITCGFLLPCLDENCEHKFHQARTLRSWRLVAKKNNK
jgi:hypothetical protein